MWGSGEALDEAVLLSGQKYILKLACLTSKEAQMLKFTREVMCIVLEMLYFCCIEGFGIFNMIIFGPGYSDCNYFHCCLCFLCVSFQNSKVFSAMISTFLRGALCWKEQRGREDFIQDLLCWLQHFCEFYGDDHQLQAISCGVPRSETKVTRWISYSSAEHKLCRDYTVNLFFISLFLFNGFERERNSVQPQCSLVLKVAGWPVSAGSVSLWVAVWFYLNTWTRLTKCYLIMQLQITFFF